MFYKALNFRTTPDLKNFLVNICAVQIHWFLLAGSKFPKPISEG